MKKIVSVVAVLAMLLCFGISEKASASPAMIGSVMSCGFTPPAPNAVDTCSGWVGSQGLSGYVYKIDATHHYGFWGPNWDPGTWHVNVYMYTAGGSYVGQQMSFDVGDWAFPEVYPSGQYQTAQIRISSNYLNYWWTGLYSYRTCDPNSSFFTVETQLQDTAAGAYAVGQVWPFGRYVGPWCQHGYGTHGSAIRSASAWDVNPYGGASSYPVGLFDLK